MFSDNTTRPVAEMYWSLFPLILSMYYVCLDNWLTPLTLIVKQASEKHYCSLWTLRAPDVTELAETKCGSESIEIKEIKIMYAAI